MSYFGWHEDDKKVPFEQRIRNALGACQRRFGHDATVVLLNADELTSAALSAECHGVDLRGETFIRKNNYWAGQR